MHRLTASLTGICAVVLALLLSAQQAAAKPKQWRDNPPGQATERHAPDNGDRYGDKRHSSEELEAWWQGLPEDEREHLRQRYEHLQELPAERRGRIHDRWQHFRDLPAEDQEKLYRHYQRWRELPPPERERLQRTWQRFRELSPDRQQMIKKELRSLRDLPPAERERRRLELHRRYFPDLPPPPPRNPRQGFDESP